MSQVRKAFLDTNVLAQVVAGSYTGQQIMFTLRAAGFEIVTFAKCQYELYALVRRTTRDRNPNKKHPLKYLVPHELNDVAQKLFKKTPDIDALGTAYFWHNLATDWEGWNYFGTPEANIEAVVCPDQHAAARVLRDKHREFLQWKQGVDRACATIDTRIAQENIQVCTYAHLYTSEWYRYEGFSQEQDLSKDALISNEDFEILLAAFYLQARVFVTEDDDVLWRGGLSLGLNSGRLSLCCPERLQDAIDTDFFLRCYRKQ